MADRLQSNFAGGELDPALQKRITLNKYHNGLATARNIVVGKTGRLTSRAGKKYIKDAGNLAGGSITIGGDKAVLVHPMPWIARYMEFGDGFVQVYEADGTVVGQGTHSFVEADLPDIRLVSVKVKNALHAVGSLADGHGVLVIKEGTDSLLIKEDGTVLTDIEIYFNVLPNTCTLETLVDGGTGYLVDYAVTTVINGEESGARFYALTSHLPISVTESVTFNLRVDELDSPVDQSLIQATDECRVYRRPRSGGAYGYIGSVKTFVYATNDLLGAFIDLGQEADYTNQPPEPLEEIYTINASLTEYISLDVWGPSGCAPYQGRLIAFKKAAMLASRPAFTGNFYKDVFVDADSALSFKLSDDGNSDILYAIEHDGLIVFTTDGVHLHQGLLSPTNLALDRKANNVIDYRVPPINVPGGVLFMDARTNTVRQLQYSDEAKGFMAEELSIFSDHLFRENRVTSWAFDAGSLPLLWVTFADGTYATFTYEKTQQMQAWTRHDSGYGIERVAYLPPGINSASVRTEGKLIFVTQATGGTQRWIEHGVKRFLRAEDFETNSEIDKGETAAAMDSMVSWSELLNDDLTDDDITLTPVVADTWDGELTLADVDDAIFPSPGAGAVGTIHRWFHPVDRTSIDLEVTARASDDSVTVQPSAEFPSAYATNPRLYKTQATFTGLDHMDGESVAVMVDGYVISSPNNDEQNYPVSTPSSGSLTLPNGIIGAIVHIGRPYVMDTETLDLKTVEQSPTHNQSITVDKVKIETYLSRGLYINGRFPSTDVVVGDDGDKAQGRSMKPLDNYLVNYEDDNPIIANRYDQPETREFDITLPGDWKSNGRVCLRQVDPVHFEILAVTVDADIERR